MKRIALKLLLFSVPLIILVILFAVMDPFRIVKNYTDYSKDLYVMPNRDYVSSELFLKNKDKYHYNSYIFGSSSTIAFNASSWKRYLSANASPFKFDGSAETIYGIYTKIIYLDKINAPIDNCLIVVDVNSTFKYDFDNPGHLVISHPTVAGTSWINFYITFIKTYLQFKFFKNFTQFSITHKWVPSMDGYINNFNLHYDTITNENARVDLDSEIMKGPDAYYEKRKAIFYKRDSIITPAEAMITKKEIGMLNEIYEIFKKHNTNYKIVVSPLYDQIKMNGADLTILQNIFGKDHVFDFSGKNKFTELKENYYESHHYRPFIGDSIMNIIYKTTAKNTKE